MRRKFLSLAVLAFAALLSAAGMAVQRWETDDAGHYALLLATPV